MAIIIPDSRQRLRINHRELLILLEFPAFL